MDPSSRVQILMLYFIRHAQNSSAGMTGKVVVGKRMMFLKVMVNQCVQCQVWLYSFLVSSLVVLISFFQDSSVWCMQDLEDVCDPC